MLADAIAAVQALPRAGHHPLRGDLVARGEVLEALRKVEQSAGRGLPGTMLSLDRAREYASAVAMLAIGGSDIGIDSAEVALQRVADAMGFGQEMRRVLASRKPADPLG